MKVYKVNEARKNFKQLLDSAREGDVFVLRRQETFRLTKELPNGVKRDVSNPGEVVSVSCATKEEISSTSATAWPSLIYGS